MDTKAVDEGVDAFCAGIPRNACAYEPGAAEHLDWMRGWDEAEAVDFEEYADYGRRWIRAMASSRA
jgi:hypothetical protein